MMRAGAAAILILLLGILAPPGACGESGPAEALRPPGPGFLQIIRTRDGSTAIGRISKIEKDTVVFETELGTLHIPADRIAGIREVPEKDYRHGNWWFPSPNSTRLFFAPTGRMLMKGAGYFADYYIFFPSVNYGVADNLSLGGGLSIFPSGSMKNQIYFFTPKIGIRRSATLNIAAGAFVLKVPNLLDEHVPLLSILYGVGTYGSSDRSVTVGMGCGFADRKAGDRPVFVIGGEYRVKRRISVVTENWIVPGAENMLVSLGIRFFGEDLSADLALFNTVGNGSAIPGIPYVDFLWHF